jgi:hypothetical protein
MSDKQDQKKKDGERKDKKNHEMHQHEHDIHAGQRHSAHPRDEQPVPANLSTQPSGVGHHKEPDDAGIDRPDMSKEDRRDMRHSHVPHVPKK